MKKSHAFALLLIAVFAISALAQGDGHKTLNAASDDLIGQTIADFKLPDTDGHQRTLSSLKGKNGTVLIFIAVQCPVSNSYNERMEKLAVDYAARGVNVVGINANSTESREEVKHHASEHKFTFTILKDEGNKIADRLGAQRTPEAFLLDAGGKLVYRGAIDNDRANRLTAEGGLLHNHLRDAIDATIAGKPIEITKVNAFGCSIKRAS